MSANSALEVKPITDADAQSVAEFLRAEFLNLGVTRTRPVTDWLHAMNPPWAAEQPNHGYMLRYNGRVVGAHLALYSERVIDGRVQRICNLGAWCVAEPHRAAGMRLLRSLLRQKGYTFTDLTPNPDVVRLNTRLGFTALDTTTVLVPNLPWPSRSRGVRVIDTPGKIDALLSGRDQEIYRDHRATAARHLVLSEGQQNCYVMYRRDRYKRRSVLATVLYVGDTDLFRRWSPDFYRYLLVRQRVLATLIEPRVVGYRPNRSISVPGRTKMYFSDNIESAQIDYLYSELTCLE
ncbi:hypothetical protein EV589_2768 [Mycobacterium sp. BK558]|nr:hypothetical protein EV589_2768 [Mycobacterium sp. BK558]